MQDSAHFYNFSSIMNLLGIIFLIVLTTGARAHSYCEVDGICHGVNLEFSSTDSSEDCHQFCQNVTGCEWYTYDTATDHCLALADCPDIDLTCATCISGEADCNCFVEGECHGTVVNIIEAKTPEECLRECQRLDGCEWFSFKKEDQACLLLEDCSLDDESAGFVSGERSCQLPKANTKIFYHLGTTATWTHMPSRLNDTSACEQPPEYPISVSTSAFAIINGRVTVCGGLPYTSLCFTLNRDFNLWIEFPELPGPRGYSASILTERGWWITGGHTGGTTSISSTVVFNASSETWMAGPELPSARNTHCLTRINDEYSFMTGGLNTGSTGLRDTWIYSWSEDLWVQMPDMNIGKWGPGCAVYADEQGHKQIFVAGGHDGTSFISRVGSFNLTSRSWTQLPNLPSATYTPGIMLDGQDIIIVNTLGSNIMRFNRATSTFELIPGLATPVSETHATIVPIDDFALFNC